LPAAICCRRRHEGARGRRGRAPDLFNDTGTLEGHGRRGRATIAATGGRHVVILSTMTNGPVLTLSQAVDVAAVSRSTLQRRLYAGAVEGAERLADGSWRIPYVALVSAGLVSKTTPPDTPTTDATGARGRRGRAPDLFNADVADLAAQVAALTADVDKWRALALERETERNKAQTMAADLVALLQSTAALNTATVATPPSTKTPPVALEGAAKFARRTWRPTSWRRR
jgi:hypothetical protein